MGQTMTIKWWQQESQKERGKEVWVQFKGFAHKFLAVFSVEIALQTHVKLFELLTQISSNEDARNNKTL